MRERTTSRDWRAFGRSSFCAMAPVPHRTRSSCLLFPRHRGGRRRSSCLIWTIPCIFGEWRGPPVKVSMWSLATCSLATMCYSMNVPVRGWRSSTGMQTEIHSRHPPASTPSSRPGTRRPGYAHSISRRAWNSALNSSYGNATAREFPVPFPAAKSCPRPLLRRRARLPEPVQPFCRLESQTRCRAR